MKETHVLKQLEIIILASYWGKYEQIKETRDYIHLFHHRSNGTISLHSAGWVCRPCEDAVSFCLLIFVKVAALLFSSLPSICLELIKPIISLFKLVRAWTYLDINSLNNKLLKLSFRKRLQNSLRNSLELSLQKWTWAEASMSSQWPSGVTSSKFPTENVTPPRKTCGLWKGTMTVYTCAKRTLKVLLFVTESTSSFSLSLPPLPITREANLSSWRPCQDWPCNRGFSFHRKPEP